MPPNSFAAGLFILTVVYILGQRFVVTGSLNLKYIFLAGVIVNIVLLFFWNAASDDLYTFIYRSRIISEFGQNPYYRPYDNFSDDPLYNSLKTIWSHKVTIYGPASLLIGSFLSRLGGDSFLLSIFVFKFAYAVLNVTNIFLVWKITKSNLSVYLYALNPVLLFEFALNNHMDLIMTTFAFLSVYFWLKKRRYPILSWIFLTISVLVKFFTAVLIPLYFVFGLKKMRGLFGKVCYGAVFGATIFMSGVLLYLPFWESPDVFSRLLEISGAETTSPAIGIRLFGRRTSVAMFWLIYLVLIFMAMRARPTKKNFLKYASLLIAVFFATGLSLFLPWYMTVLISVLVLYVGFSKKAWYVHIATLYAAGIYLTL